MKTSWKLPLFIVVLILMSFSVLENPGKRVEKEIRDVFQTEAFNYSHPNIPDNLKSELPSKITKDNFFQINSGGSLLGYAYVDKAPSKTAQFDYLVILDKDLKIRRTKVMVYREEYGGEIGSRRWLKQFIGKAPGDNMNDVAAISGATISVRSMKRAVQNILDSLKVLKINNII